MQNRGNEKCTMTNAKLKLEELAIGVFQFTFCIFHFAFFIVPFHMYRPALDSVLSSVRWKA